MEILRACPFLLAAAALLASVGRSAEEAGPTGLPSASFPGISAAKRGPSPAPAAGRMRLSMKDAVTGALETAQRIGEARAAYERSDAAVLQAFSGALPSLSANASFTRTRGPFFGGAFAGAATGTTGSTGALSAGGSQYTNFYDANLQLTQPLFTGGAVYYGVKSARRLRAAALEDARTARQTTIFNARQDYYNAVLTAKVQAVVQSSYDLARLHYEDVRERMEAGVATKYDVLTAKVAMQNQKSQLIGAENNARLAMAALLREAGLPLDARVELVDGFEEPGPATAVGQTVEGALATALKCRPELASAELGTEAQRNAVGAARAGYFPAVSANASIGGFALADPFRDGNFIDTRSVGAQLQWNIFDGALTRARVAEARAGLVQSQWQEQGLRRDVELQVRQAVLNLQSAINFVASQGGNVEEAREALRMAEARQKAGAGTELDVQDARNALEQAELNYVQSLSQYANAKLALEQATGTLEPPPGKP